MYDFLINQYINRLTKDEIKCFAYKKGVELTEEETNTIYDYTKKHWRTFLHGNPRPILDELKSKVKPFTYNKMETLYIEAKDKYLK